MHVYRSSSCLFFLNIPAYARSRLESPSKLLRMGLCRNMLASLGFEFFCKGDVCGNFFDGVPPQQGYYEMALSMPGDRRGLWEETFKQKWVSPKIARSKSSSLWRLACCLRRQSSTLKSSMCRVPACGGCTTGKLHGAAGGATWALWESLLAHGLRLALGCYSKWVCQLAFGHAPLLLVSRRISCGVQACCRTRWCPFLRVWCVCVCVLAFAPLACARLAAFFVFTTPCAVC